MSILCHQHFHMSPDISRTDKMDESQKKRRAFLMTIECKQMTQITIIFDKFEVKNILKKYTVNVKSCQIKQIANKCKRSANARMLFSNDYLICHEYINYNYKYELYYIRQSKQRSFRSRKNIFLKFTQFFVWQICFHFFLTLNISERQIGEKKHHKFANGVTSSSPIGLSNVSFIV